MTRTHKGAPSFQMKEDMPMGGTHRAQIPRPHIATEIAEGRHADAELVESLTYKLHRRVLRPSMTLTTAGGK